MAKASAARLRANDKYDKKAYDKILIRVRSDGDINKAVLQAAADKVAGGSLNGFIVDAVTKVAADILTLEEIETARTAQAENQNSDND